MPNRIRRWVETDTGHRVPNHSSKCRHMHGHRYRWEAELEGDVVTKRGVSEEGMLIDFSEVSENENPAEFALPSWCVCYASYACSKCSTS